MQFLKVKPPISVAVAYRQLRGASHRDAEMFRQVVDDRLAGEIGRRIMEQIPVEHVASPGAERGPCYITPEIRQVAQVTVYVFTEEELDALVKEARGQKIHV